MRLNILHTESVCASVSLQIPINMQIKGKSKTFPGQQKTLSGRLLICPTLCYCFLHMMILGISQCSKLCPPIEEEEGLMIWAPRAKKLNNILYSVCENFIPISSLSHSTMKNCNRKFKVLPPKLLSTSNANVINQWVNASNSQQTTLHFSKKWNIYW